MTEGKFLRSFLLDIEKAAAKNLQQLFLHFFIHGNCIVLANIVSYLYDLYCHGSCAHSNFDPIAYLDLVTGLDYATVYTDAAVVAGFIGHRPTLDQAGDLQVLVKSHKQ